MDQYERFNFERDLSRCAAEISKQMSELRRLRELVRLAERRLGVPSNLRFETHRACLRPSSLRQASADASRVLTKFFKVDPHTEILLSPGGKVCG